MAKTVAVGEPDDWARWLALGAALAGVGILPKNWQKGLSFACALVVILKFL